MTHPAHEAPPFPIGKFAMVHGGRLRLHYHEAGAPSAGKPTLLYLHGSGPGASGYSNFRRNFPSMVQAGYHILAVDYIGYGHSDMPRDFQYSNANQVAILHEFLAQKGIGQIVPIGNSLGGFFALEYTLRFPNEVSKLICMAPGGIEDVSRWIAESPGMTAMGVAVRKGNFDRVNFRELLKLIVKDEAHLTDEVIAERLPIARKQPLEIFTTVKYSPIWDRLGEIRVPVLGFWGYHDQFLPVRHALLMQKILPDCRMVLSNRAGHWFMIEEAELFNSTCLQFLRESRDA
jgi:4,5:9,10-diseco-3-hydroxy-5,9,17-trioxoandrosta-1(10),2-diene-4-oate hydrolase